MSGRRQQKHLLRTRVPSGAKSGIHSDIAAELGALRDRTVEHAQEVRALELERLDGMTSGLWPQIRAGSPPAVTAAIRVSERRSRLLGLDEPVVTKSELTGSLALTAQSQFKAQAEELRWLDLDELESLAEASDRLIGDAIAASKARRTPRLIDVSASPAAAVDDVVAGEPVEQSMTPSDNDQRGAEGAETAPRDRP